LKGWIVTFRAALIGWLAALTLGVGACGAAPALLSVQFAPTSGGTEILLALAAPVPFHAEVTGVAAAGHVEVTLDAAGVALGATAGRGFGPVTSFRAEAAESGHTRYVFDLAQPVTILGAHIQPARPGAPAYAIVELAPTDAIAMTAAVGQVVTPTVAQPATPDAGKLAAAKSGPSRPPKGEGAKTAPPAAAEVALAGPKRPAPKPAVVPTGKRIIVIDPGHGGIDPGADSVAGYHEKEITLATARVLKRVLEDTGRYKVVLTRDRDVYLKLPERVRRARAAHGELLISLHADSLGGGPLQPASDRGRARGASIYTLSETATDAESERLAQHENRADALGGVDLEGESDDVAGILVDLTVRETVNNGNRFAAMLVKSLGEQGVALFPRMPHRSAGFAVLKAPDIPSVLVEMGYLSDIGEARGLADPSYRRRIATAIAGAVDHYFAWTEAAR
jgi:N-acetylmuramoyl-L-alanine amidase